ncbi:serum response factor-like isoform X1 [Solea senegalensis]|uniref:Serum response factor n=1 Tax=Solea senegalensis TaxID=28829 RepID=A0AAV6QAM2_SOLSE|nr:serum response factor-like isoform X1 [Solea senegalensis]
MGTRTGSGRAGNGTGLNSLAVNTPGPNSGSDGAQFDDRGYGIEVVYSGSDQDSESGDEEDPAGSGGDRRGVKRERSDGKAGHQSSASGGVPGARPGKKTRGRVKIKMEFIDNKLRRYTTFSKRKTGIMKKAYELSTLTGTQVLLLVASETGHVYTFATRKLQPMITSETGKALIQTCLNSPDSPPRSDPSSDQRMSATGFEETDLTYQVSEVDGCSDVAKDPMKPAHALSTQAPPSSSVQTSAPSWQPQSSSNGSVIKTSAGVVLPGGFTLMPASWPRPLRYVTASWHTHHPPQSAADSTSDHPGSRLHTACSADISDHAAPSPSHRVTGRGRSLSAVADSPSADQQ